MKKLKVMLTILLLIFLAVAICYMVYTANNLPATASIKGVIYG